MKAIWKFPVHTTDAFEIEMPQGATLLAVQTQVGDPQLWALVNPDAPRVTRAFRVVGTGHYHPDERFGDYVGTYQLLNGGLVFHVFDMGEVQS